MSWATGWGQHATSIWVRLNLQARQSRTLKNQWLHPRQPEGKTIFDREERDAFEWEWVHYVPGRKQLLSWMFQYSEKNLKFLQSPEKTLCQPVGASVFHTGVEFYHKSGRSPFLVGATVPVTKLGELPTNHSASRKYLHQYYKCHKGTYVVADRE